MIKPKYHMIFQQRTNLIIFELASLSGLQFTEEYLDWLDTITTFNMNARYDSYKEAFYKKCTFDFTTGWIEKITILQSWIKEKL